MTHTLRSTRLAVLVAVLALVGTACRSNTGAPSAEPDAGSPAAGGSEPAASGDIKTDVGVTEEACPDAVNPDNGCIYLGTISDLTEGPFAALAVFITDAQEAFWNTVNEDGGIGGYDIDVTTYVRDNKYNPEVHNQVYQEIKPNVLALAQSLGSPTTAAILDDLEASNVVTVPASWTSAWEFSDVIIESGTNYCLESMNAIDYALEEFGEDLSVMAVHYPGDYGGDAAAGAKVAAEANELEFTDVETAPGQENQAGAVDEIVSKKPDVVILTTGPTDAAVIVGQAAARGFKGRYLGTSPSWNPGLLQSPAADALKAQYLQTSYWESFEADTPGHQAMREALGDDVEGNDGYTSGWVWSYPLKAALQAAAESGDLTREGLLNAVRSLESVDYQGMLPEEAGRFAGEPNETVFRQIIVSKPDESTTTGVSKIEDFFVSETAKNYKLEAPCFEAAAG
ncbi:MAG: ABC transporter substrate-binding protein [Actinomycetota bacterium]|nr:ABC transporter substrate-binding protein [Actinomycetota bacterium]